MKIDDILKRYGIAYEELRPDELETLHTWLRALDEGKITLEKIKAYIASMRDSVESELTKPNLDSQTDLFLKARLRNYMLLEAFLSSPKKIRQMLERAMAGIAKPKK